MRFLATAMLAVYVIQAAALPCAAQERPIGWPDHHQRVQQAYLPEGGGYRPNYRSDYTEGQSGYRSTPFEAEVGTHVPRLEKYEYPVYMGDHPLGVSRTSWSRPTRGYSPPGTRANVPGYISHMRMTNDPPSWVNRESVRPDERAMREAAKVQLPPSWTPAGQQLEQQMRPQEPPPTFRQRVRSWLPW